MTRKPPAHAHYQEQPRQRLKKDGHRPCPRADAQPECASRQKPLTTRRPTFFIAAQPVDASREIRPGYDDCTSGPIIYAYVGGNPVSKIDPLGLETFLCNRPLDGFHGVSVGPLFHQFLCTLDAKGKVNCGGLGPRDGSNGMFGGPGKIEPEASVRPEQCEKIRDLDQCFEKCVDDSLASPAQNYDVRAGRSWLFPRYNTQQCQVYAKSVLDRCSVQCRK